MNDDLVYQEAQTMFNDALARHTETEIQSARAGCGLRAARFACTFVKPEDNQNLYTRIYNIFWDYYHPEVHTS